MGLTDRFPFPLCDAQETSILREAVSAKSLQALTDLHTHARIHIFTLTQSEGHIQKCQHQLHFHALAPSFSFFHFL